MTHMWLVAACFSPDLTRFQIAFDQKNAARGQSSDIDSDGMQGSQPYAHRTRTIRALTVRTV